MTTSLVSSLPAIRVSRRRLFQGLSVLTFLFALSSALLAQTDPNAADNTNAGGRGRRNQQNGGGNNNGGGNGGGRGNFDPAQMQQQMVDRIREQLGVTDDAEWKVIMDRVTPVMELQRSTRGGGGFGGFRGGQAGPGGQGGGGRRGNLAANPEQTALQQAIADKLPDAEIKSRLERLREVRKANEEKLTKAQEDLRAVLSVRQEAVAVMFGLLP
jgi:hypothetical protein